MTGRSSGPTSSMMASAMRRHLQGHGSTKAGPAGTPDAQPVSGFASLTCREGLPLPFVVVAPASAFRAIQRCNQLVPGGDVPVRQVVVLVFQVEAASFLDRFRFFTLLVRRFGAAPGGGFTFDGLPALAAATATAPPRPVAGLGGWFLGAGVGRL